MTYTESGVDIDKEDKAIKGMLSSLRFKREGKGRALEGHYAGLVEFEDYALVLCTDGVGTKVKIATALKKWDTVGIDCIAMNVNDAICVGAEPLAFVDYLAIDDPDPQVTKDIGKGLEEGARLSNVSIIGGETATLPEIVSGFDLAGTCLGYVKKDGIVTGEKISKGDILIGLESSGIHSNGFTLVRKTLEEKDIAFDEKTPEIGYSDKTVGEVLLTPTRIYVEEILEVLKRINVHGLAHITGGGLKNLSRLNENVRFLIDDPLNPHSEFVFIQQLGNIEDVEMYRTFNMGMGFVVIVSEEDAEETLQILKRHAKYTVKKVGHVEEGSGVVVPSKELEY